MEWSYATYAIHVALTTVGYWITLEYGMLCKIRKEPIAMEGDRGALGGSVDTDIGIHTSSSPTMSISLWDSLGAETDKIRCQRCLKPATQTHTKECNRVMTSYMPSK